MAVDTSVRASRRALITAGAAGLIAAVATALGRPLGVRAANGDPLLAGSVVGATSTTGATTTTGNGLQGTTDDLNASGIYGFNQYGGYGVAGRSFVGGDAGPIRIGVYGESGYQGTGVRGHGHWGVVGESDSWDRYTTTYGVHGIGANAIKATVPSWIEQEPYINPIAIEAQGHRGMGVYSVGGSHGVYGKTAGGQGVRGEATTGTGVYAQAGTSGTALNVRGKAIFSRSGKVGAVAGAVSVTKTLPGLTSASIVFAVLNTNEPGVWVRAAVAGAGTFTVYFNTPLPTSAAVGWFVLN
jgi:hypothetical protein